MKNFGINLVGILKYLKGTPEGGVLRSSNWTSEYISPFRNKKVRPIKELEELIIGKKQKEGAKRFDKGFKTLWGIMSLTPMFSVGTDIVDMGLAHMNKQGDEATTSAKGALAKVFYLQANNIDSRKAKNFKLFKKAVLAKIFGNLFGVTYALPDIVDDGTDLYNNITEKYE